MQRDQSWSLTLRGDDSERAYFRQQSYVLYKTSFVSGWTYLAPYAKIAKL